MLEASTWLLFWTLEEFLVLLSYPSVTSQCLMGSSSNGSSAFTDRPIKRVLSINLADALNRTMACLVGSKDHVHSAVRAHLSPFYVYRTTCTTATARRRSWRSEAGSWTLQSFASFAPRFFRPRRWVTATTLVSLQLPFFVAAPRTSLAGLLSTVTTFPCTDYKT